jgi:hypothetical protein
MASYQFSEHLHASEEVRGDVIDEWCIEDPHPHIAPNTQRQLETELAGKKGLDVAVL